MIKKIIRYLKSFVNDKYANIDMFEYSKNKRSKEDKIIEKINKEKRC